LNPRVEFLLIGTSMTAPDENDTRPTRSPPAPALNLLMKSLTAAVFRVARSEELSEPDVSITSITSRSRRIASPIAATPVPVGPSTRMKVVGMSALPETVMRQCPVLSCTAVVDGAPRVDPRRSEEHTSELQSRENL